MSSLSFAPRAVALRQPYRWVVLTLTWAAFTMTSVDRSSWGPASVTVGEHLGVSLAGLGLFATGYYVGYVISNVSGGVLSDWLGGRAVNEPTVFRRVRCLDPPTAPHVKVAPPPMRPPSPGGCSLF